MTTTFTVPGNPIPLARPRVVKGHTYTDPRSEAFKRKVAEVAQGYFMLAFTGPVEVSVAFYRSSAQRCDLDNLVKGALDALLRIAYVDDSQVVNLTASKAIDRENPRTDVVVRPLTEAAVTVDAAAVQRERDGARSTPEALASILGPKGRTKLMRAKGKLVSSVRRNP